MRMLFTNDNLGIQSIVYELVSKPGWYSVTLKDLDSGELIPYARHIDNVEGAIKLAREWANIHPMWSA